jgi:hypothetical protein
MPRFTPCQRRLIIRVGPEDTIHIGNPHAFPYLGGERLDHDPSTLLRLVGLGILAFEPDNPVRLRLTPAGLEARQRLLAEYRPRAIVEHRR